MSYTIDPSDNVLKILTEDHYYPFGMRQYGYTRDIRVPPGLATLMVMDDNDLAYKYKFQDQERQDELSLNWDSFKWRNYDYAIGRFMSIDPLATKYVYNSTYAFQENKLGLGRELEGLELVYREGTSPEFKKSFGNTVQYMNKKKTSGLINKLNSLESKTELDDNTGGGSF